MRKILTKRILAAALLGAICLSGAPRAEAGIFSSVGVLLKLRSQQPPRRPRPTLPQKQEEAPQPLPIWVKQTR